MVVLHGPMRHVYNVYNYGSSFSVVHGVVNNGDNLPCTMQANLGRAQHELAALLALAARFPGYLAPLQPAAHMLVGAQHMQIRD